MKHDEQLIANIEAIFSGYCHKPSTEWTWEKAMFAIARSSFGAPAGRGDPIEFEIRGKPYREWGTPSDQWNAAILAAAASVRKLETPDAHDYYKDLYANPAKRKLAAQRVADALSEELRRAKLQPSLNP